MPTTAQTHLEFIYPFVEAALKTLEVQCQMPATTGKPFLKGQAAQDQVDIAAVIALTSPACLGSVAICFPKKVFLEVMGRMLGENYTEITHELQDGASEILNITFGQAKVILNERGYGLEKAIPTIVSGNNITVMHMTRVRTIVLPFTSESGPFYIEVAISFTDKKPG